MLLRAKRPKWWLIIGTASAALMALYVGLMLWLPAPKPVVSLMASTGTVDTGKPTPLPWPSAGGAAIGVVGSGVLAANNADQPMPTASIAKVVLALAVLKQKPLQLGHPGPAITFTAADEALYKQELARDGSTVPIQAGTVLTEYQALQAMLLPSANNVADSLANWAFGSQQEYLASATAMLHAMGLTSTVVADASGFLPNTVSTPRELVLIGEEAMRNPVLAQIVGQKHVSLPIGEFDNVNADLGQRDINGIKTGNTNAAGGCLLFSATRQVDGQTITMVGAVQGMANLQSALDAAPNLVDTAYLNMAYVSLPQHVGTMTVAWAPATYIVPKTDVGQIAWRGTPLSRTVVVTPGTSGDVGRAQVGTKQTQLVLESSLPQPDAWWRLSHPWHIIKALF